MICFPNCRPPCMSKQASKVNETTPLLKPEAPPPIAPLANNQKSAPISAPITAQLNGKIQEAITTEQFTNENQLKMIKDNHTTRLGATTDTNTKQRLAHRITQLNLIIQHLESNPNKNIEIITIGFDTDCTIKTESRQGISQLDTILLKDPRTNNYEIIRLSGSYSMQKDYSFLLHSLTNKKNITNKENALDNLKLNNVTMTVAASAASKPIPDWNPFINTFIANHIFKKEEAGKSLLEKYTEAPHWLDPLWACTGTPFGKKTKKNPLPNRSISRKASVGASIVGASAALVVGGALAATGAGAAVGVPLMIGSGIVFGGIGSATIITRQRRHNNAYYVNDTLNKLRRSIEQDKTSEQDKPSVEQSSSENETPEAVHGLKQNFDRGYGPPAMFRVVGTNALSAVRILLLATQTMPILGSTINLFASIATPLLDWIRMGTLTDQFRDEEYVAILEALEALKQTTEGETIKEILKNDLDFDHKYFDKNNYYRKKTPPSFWDKWEFGPRKIYNSPEKHLDSHKKLQLFLVLGFLYHNRCNTKIKDKPFLSPLSTELNKLNSYTEPWIIKIMQRIIKIMQKTDKELVKYENEIISTASYMLLLDKKMNSLLFEKTAIPEKFKKFIPHQRNNLFHPSKLYRTWDTIEHDRITLLIKKLLCSCESSNKKIKDRNINNLYTLLEKLCGDNNPLTLTKIRSIVGDIGGHGHVKDVKNRYLVSIEELTKFVDIINRCSDTTQSDSIDSKPTRTHSTSSTNSSTKSE